LKQALANMRPGWQPLLPHHAPQQLPRDQSLAQDGNLEQTLQQDTTVGHSWQTSNIMRNPLLNQATPGVPNISAPPLPRPPLLSQSAPITTQQHLLRTRPIGTRTRPLGTPIWHVHISQHQARPPGPAAVIPGRPVTTEIVNNYRHGQGPPQGLGGYPAPLNAGPWFPTHSPAQQSGPSPPQIAGVQGPPQDSGDDYPAPPYVGEPQQYVMHSGMPHEPATFTLAQQSGPSPPQNAGDQGPPQGLVGHPAPPNAGLPLPIHTPAQVSGISPLQNAGGPQQYLLYPGTHQEPSIPPNQMTHSHPEATGPQSNHHQMTRRGRHRQAYDEVFRRITPQQIATYDEAFRRITPQQRATYRRYYLEGQQHLATYRRYYSERYRGDPIRSENGLSSPTLDEPTAVSTNSTTTNEPKLLESRLDCPICMEALQSLPAPKCVMATPCGHLFCNLCLDEALKVKNQCPTCKRRVEGVKVDGAKRVFL